MAAGVDGTAAGVETRPVGELVATGVLDTVEGAAALFLAFQIRYRRIITPRAISPIFVCFVIPDRCYWIQQ